MAATRGNWVHVPKEVVKNLSPISKTEGGHSEQAAYLSLRFDLKDGTVKGLREYARIWKWSPKAVVNFFKKIGYKTGFSDKELRKQSGNNRETDKFFVFNDETDGKETIGKQSGNTTISTDTDTENTKDLKDMSPNGTPKKQRSAASEQEVIDYLRSQNISDPEYHGRKFFAFYEANGWVQGKSKKPLVNWKAAVRTWDLPKVGKEIKI